MDEYCEVFVKALPHGATIAFRIAWEALEKIAVYVLPSFRLNLKPRARLLLALNAKVAGQLLSELRIIGLVHAFLHHGQIVCILKRYEPLIHH